MFRLLETILYHFGKTYTPDRAIPVWHIMRLMLRRVSWSLRGILRTRHIIFLGPNVTIEHCNNIAFGRGVTLENDVWLNAVANEKLMIGDHVKFGAYSRVMCTAHLSRLGKFFRIGDHSAFGEFCYFGAAGGIVIGKRVIMGQYVSFHAQNHHFADVETTIQDQGTFEQGIIVGNDCWIGAKATILDGTQIGNHCVVAAGAVVSGVFPDYCVIAGVPARIIRQLKDTT